MLLTELKGIKFSKLSFMEKVISEFKNKEFENSKKIFEKVLLNYADSEDLIYFAHQLENPDLLARDDEVMESLLIENFDKESQS